MNEKLLDFINNSPTPFHAVAETVRLLDEAGFKPLNESEIWKLEPGNGYYVTRNGSSLVAFRVVEGAEGFMITATHCDSPCFRVNENAVAESGPYLRLSVEGYGNMIYSTWLDRPLGVAGRVLVRTPEGVKARLLDFGEPVCLMPNVAIHMYKNLNKENLYNPAVDLQPLYAVKGDGTASFRERVAEKLGVAESDILSHDLCVYNPAKGVRWGDFISAPRLDDLQCTYATLKAFVEEENPQNIPILAVFDNEEVGSRTKQGAASSFLHDAMQRICLRLGMSLPRALSNSLMLSCDNAHALHPNHPELAEKNNAPRMNGGIVIKYTASQRYATDAVSAAIFGLICERAGVRTQIYVNRPDIPGGSTLGNISNGQVSLNTIDIGLAQLAMHSSFETAGAKDSEELFAACRLFFRSRITMKSDGEYELILTSDKKV